MVHPRRVRTEFQYQLWIICVLDRPVLLAWLSVAAFGGSDFNR